MDEENKEVVQEDVSAEPSVSEEAAEAVEASVETGEVPEVVEAQPENTPEEVLE